MNLRHNQNVTILPSDKYTLLIWRQFVSITRRSSLSHRIMAEKPLYQIYDNLFNIKNLYSALDF